MSSDTSPVAWDAFYFPTGVDIKPSATPLQRVAPSKPLPYTYKEVVQMLDRLFPSVGLVPTKSGHAITPEQRLWLAVLEDGLRLVQLRNRAAMEWLFSYAAPTAVGSFNFCCDVLNVDAKQLRQAFWEKKVDLNYKHYQRLASVG